MLNLRDPFEPEPPRLADSVLWGTGIGLVTLLGLIVVNNAVGHQILTNWDFAISAWIGFAGGAIIYMLED